MATITLERLNETFDLLNNFTTKNAVTQYALELLEDLIENHACTKQDLNKYSLKQAMLNGAQNWRQYSYGGQSLIYNEDIKERLGLPSDADNSNLLDLQAIQLDKASKFIATLIS